MSLGAGGTLLRKAVKNDPSSVDIDSMYVQRGDVVDTKSPVRAVTAPSQEDDLSFAIERSFTCISVEEEPLPLPPPPNTSMSMTCLDSIYLLPAPPLPSPVQQPQLGTAIPRS